MPLRIESLVLNELLNNEEYTRKVIPFLKEEYFSREEKKIFTLIQEFVTKYNKIPNYDVLRVDTDESEDNVLDKIEELEKQSRENIEPTWLIDKTEEFCKNQAINVALEEAIMIRAGEVKGKTNEAIPGILQEALGVSFDPEIGHEYLEDWEERFNYYHTKETKIPTDIQLLNKITKGGLPIKTLNVFMAGVGVGKTLTLSHLAASFLVQGIDTLYIALEEGEEKIGRRVDANALHLNIDTIEDLPKDLYSKKVEKLKQKIKGIGKLFIKEYPPATVHAGHFRHLLHELKLKKNFSPKVILIDYINLCTSSRIKNNGSVNSYTLIKSIAEELRGLAVEFRVPVITATQVTRSGYDNSDVEMTDVAESGTPMTADFILALSISEELEKMNQIFAKQLKTRYNDIALNRKFLIGYDKSKMRLYDVEESVQNDIQQEDIVDTPRPKITKDKKDKFAAFKFGE